MEEFASTRSNATNPRKYKLNNPDPFDGGDKSNLRRFLMQLQAIFDDDPSGFSEDKTKVNYAVSLFQGAASSWLESQYELAEPPAWKTDFSLFKAELKRVFDQANHYLKNASELSALKQTGSVKAYTVEFRRLASRLEWASQPLTFLYYQGLNKSIRVEMIKSPQVHELGFDDFTTLASNVELSLNQYGQEQDQLPSRSARPAEPSIPRPPTRRLTEQQKEYRRKNNLCLYCGSEGHLLRNCPTLPKGPPHSARVSEATLVAPEPLGKGPTQLM